MDRSGCFIFAQFCLGGNDRYVYTSSPLYFHEGIFFVTMNSWQQMVYYHRFCCSYKNLGNDEVKKLFNLTWCEEQLLKGGSLVPIIGKQQENIELF